MEYDLLGKSDLKISRIGMGTMSLEPGNPNSEGLIQQAMDAGINFIDTADMYLRGLTETMLGRSLRGKRNQVILATKVGNRWRADGSGWDWVPSKKYIITSVEESLKRLQTDFVDLYQLHGGTLEDPIEEIIEAFEILKEAGKIRYYGISSIRPNVIREYVRRSSIVSVMMQYSLLDRRPEEEMLGFLFSNQIGVLARGVLARGLLVSKPATPYLNYSADEVATTRQRILEFAPGSQQSEDLSIQYVLKSPAVSSVVIGMRTKEHLRAALEAMEAGPLTDQFMMKLSGSLPVNFYEKNL